MRLLVYAVALLGYAGCLAALGSPWAGVAAAALSLVAVVAFEATASSRSATKAEDAEDASSSVEALHRQAEAFDGRIRTLEETTRGASLDQALKTAQIDTLVSQVAILKRNAALNQVG